MTFDVETDLERAVREELNKKDHVSAISTPHVYASEALGCDRKVAYRLLGVENYFATSTLINFFLGNKLHDVVQSALIKLYPDFQAEVRWALQDSSVSGRADGVYTREDGEKVIIEIKSASSTSYNKSVKEGFPQANHVMQAQLSAYILKCTQIHIIYICKNSFGATNPLAEWKFSASHEMAKAELARMRGVLTLTQKNVVPPRLYQGEEILDPMKNKEACGYCDFKQRCVMQGPGERPFESVDDA